MRGVREPGRNLPEYHRNVLGAADGGERCRSGQSIIYGFVGIYGTSVRGLHPGLTLGLDPGSQRLLLTPPQPWIGHSCLQLSREQLISRTHAVSWELVWRRSSGGSTPEAREGFHRNLKVRWQVRRPRLAPHDEPRKPASLFVKVATFPCVVAWALLPSLLALSAARGAVARFTLGAPEVPNPGPSAVSVVPLTHCVAFVTSFGLEGFYIRGQTASDRLSAPPLAYLIEVVLAARLCED